RSSLMTYHFIDHTADIGIRIVSEDIKSLFEEAALALADIMGARIPQGGKSERITAEGLDQVDVLVRWLQEILYRIEVEDLRISQVEILELNPNGLTALVAGTNSPTELLEEIKAVTYHNLEIREVDNHVETTIIFDT
nr:archease [Deltaproteobacteria bacterium]